MKSFGCMLAVRTPGAPQTARVVAACDSAFPFERQGRLLRSRSISGLFSRSLHSGLQPPCLRFAVAVAGHHARLGTRLLARLCRGCHLRQLSSTRLQGATPHRSRRAALPQWALQEGPEADRSSVPSLVDNRFGEWEGGQESGVGRPGHTALLAAFAECLAPEPDDTVLEHA